MPEARLPAVIPVRNFHAAAMPRQLAERSRLATTGDSAFLVSTGIAFLSFRLVLETP